MFLMDLIMHSLVKVMYFYPHGCCKAYDVSSFYSMCFFAQSCLMVNGSMKFIKARNFLMVGTRWGVESGADHKFKKVYRWLDPVEGRSCM